MKPPRGVQLTSGGLAIWLSYEAATLADAVAIMRAAPIVPFWKYKGIYTRLQPDALAKPDEKSQSGPFAASLKVDQGEGYGPCVELRFYVMAGTELCHAHVRIGTGLYGQHSKWGAQANHTYDDRHAVRGPGRLVKRNWLANRTLAAVSDEQIKWGTGDDKSACWEYLWMADTVDGGAEHASCQLMNL